MHSLHVCARLIHSLTLYSVKSSDVDPPIPIFIAPLKCLATNKLNGSSISEFGGSVCLELTKGFDEAKLSEALKVVEAINIS